MLKGNNEITLNSATVRMIVQYYFDNVLFKDGASPTIANVEFNNTFDRVLTVHMTDDEQVPKSV